MLYEELERYALSGVTPMHVPGHKRNTRMLGDGLPYGIDITELPGFDNLRDMRGMLRDTAELAARLYGCHAAFPLVNGSTGGLLAAVRALAGRRGGASRRVVMARNCHVSVYSAVELCGLEPVYITPEKDPSYGIARSIAPEQVSRALDGVPQCPLVIVTSPTYEGVVSDIAEIADISHSRGARLLVDEAHGAHLGFSAFFPAEAASQGADVAVMSLHKTLPALTQSSLALVGSGARRPFELARELARELSVFQTSSPSYILLASIDRCLRILDERSDGLFLEFEDKLRCFDARIAGMKRLRVFGHSPDTTCERSGVFGIDPGKLVICSGETGAGGSLLAETLRSRYQIETEMAAAGYVIAVATVCDSAENLEKLADALTEMDSSSRWIPGRKRAGETARGNPARTFPDVEAGAGELRAYEDAVGEQALESMAAYPPGVPIIAEGDIISAQSVRAIRELEAAGIDVVGGRGSPPGHILVAVAKDAD